MLSLLVSLLLCSFTMGADILVAGDSWASMGKDEFAEVMSTRGGLTVNNIGIGATTSSNWGNEYPNKIVDAVEPDTQAIWITVGGNDMIGDLPNCLKEKSAAECFKDVKETIVGNNKKFLDPLFAKYPNMQVVEFGYDILQFGDLICSLLADGLAPDCTWSAEKTACRNTHFLSIQGAVDEVSNTYPGVTGLNLLGSMQAAAGVSGAAIGKPVLSQYSPTEYMADCIHPNPDGFKIVFNNLYDKYFAGIFKNSTKDAPVRRAHHHHGHGIGPLRGLPNKGWAH